MKPDKDKKEKERVWGRNDKPKGMKKQNRKMEEKQTLQRGQGGGFKSQSHFCFWQSVLAKVGRAQLHFGVSLISVGLHKLR